MGVLVSRFFFELQDCYEKYAAHKTKLTTPPAPAAAIINWSSGNFADGGMLFQCRIVSCNSLYAKNIEAFSAMAPTMGAGRP
jgi:hypothetical protein